jgi:hypothetical protein
MGGVSVKNGERAIGIMNGENKETRKTGAGGGKIE